MNKTSRKKFQIISPDGIPLTPKPFQTRQAAEAYIPVWCARFESQGYYAAVDGHIPLADLPSRCAIQEV